MVLPLINWRNIGFMNKKGFAGRSMNLVIGGLIVLVLVGALLPTIADNTIGIQGTGNITGATSTLLGLTPLILIIGLVVVLLAGAGIKMTGR